MKILHTVQGMSTAGGGVSTCVADLMRGLRNAGADANLICLKSDGQTVGDGERWLRQLPDDSITPYAYSRNLRKELSRINHDNVDIMHTNGMWLDINHATISRASHIDVPSVLSPHGMLYPEALSRSKWKKRLMLSMIFDRDLKNVTAIHATCETERDNYLALGYKQPVAVIPNPVVIPKYISELSNDRSSHPRRIGYLGRLHPYKRPDALIQAWAKLGTSVASSELIIMGSGDAAYEQMLKDLTENLNLKNVKFTGSVIGEEKYRLLSSLTALCLPSKTENFGMTVAEALLASTPVICTNTAPWKELESEKCGWWVDNSIDSLAEHIQAALQLPDDEIAAMGQRGRALVKRRYSAPAVAAQMLEFYRSLL